MNRLEQVREILSDAHWTLTAHTSDTSLGARHAKLVERLRQARAWDAAGADVALMEALSAVAAVQGFVEGRGPDGVVSKEECSELRTRLQNAIDGLPTQLGGTPRLP